MQHQDQVCKENRFWGYIDKTPKTWSISYPFISNRSTLKSCSLFERRAERASKEQRGANQWRVSQRSIQRPLLFSLTRLDPFAPQLHSPSSPSPVSKLNAHSQTLNLQTLTLQFLSTGRRISHEGIRIRVPLRVSNVASTEIATEEVQSFSPICKISFWWHFFMWCCLLNWQ